MENGAGKYETMLSEANSDSDNDKCICQTTE
jgi:hypothetical protein